MVTTPSSDKQVDTYKMSKEKDESLNDNLLIYIDDNSSISKTKTQDIDYK
jgi:hypothetical protein